MVLLRDSRLSSYSFALPGAVFPKELLSFLEVRVLDQPSPAFSGTPFVDRIAKHGVLSSSRCHGSFHREYVGF